MKLTEAKGDWALVTGASSGIGREFAIQLAAAGLNLALVARRKDLLDALCAELSAKYAIQTHALDIDLTQSAAANIIKSRLTSEGIRIRLLVNNAAVGRWGHFEATPVSIYKQMVELNITALVSMCHLFMDDLTSYPTSAIINVSSQAAYNPVPYMAVYAATKAFVSSFSQAIYEEWRDRGVLVQTLVPGPTKTDFDRTAGAYASGPQERGTADSVVKTSLSHLGVDTPMAVAAKGVFKQRFFAFLFPPGLVVKTVGRMFRPPSDKRK